MKWQNRKILLVGFGTVLGGSVMAFIVWVWIAITHMVAGIFFFLTLVLIVSISSIIFLWYRKKRANVAKRFENALVKYLLYCNIFTSWMVYKNKGKTLADYFKDHEYRSIAIYGLNRLGICLYGELKPSDINVKYAIDTNAGHFSYLDIPVVRPTDFLKAVDAIIVANVEQFDDISSDLTKEGRFNVISLEDIVASI